MSNVKLLIVTISLSEEGLRFTRRMREYKETDKMFIPDTTADYRGSQLKKVDILQPDTKFRNELGSLITYRIFCYPQDERKAIQILNDCVNRRLEYFETQLEMLKIGVNKPILTRDLK